MAEVAQSAPEMRSIHLLSLIVDLVDYIVKDLPVREHPVAIEQEKDRCIAELSDGILGHHVIHRWWHLMSVSNMVSFHRIIHKVGEKGDREEHG